jgi:hypothetical protein
MAEDKYLLEDGSGGYQLEDASGVLLIDYPQADAALGGTTGQLYPRPVVQYQALAAPMVAGSGVSWMPRLPDTVQRAVVGLSMVVAPLLPQPAAQTWVHPQTPALVQPTAAYRSIVAAPLSPPQAAITWTPQYAPEPIRSPGLIASVAAFPPSVTASLPQNVTWWPQFPDRVVQWVRFQEPLTVGPPVSPTLPNAADAGIQGSSGQLYAPPVVQYQAIAGPVLVPAAAAPIIPLQFNADGLIRPDSWTHNQAVAGPVAIPITVGWWPRLPDPVQVPVRPVFSFYSNPIQPLNPAALSALPWLMRNQPLILPQYPTRHVLALNPTTPAPVAVVIPWLVPPGQLIFRPVARYDAYYAKPLRPQDPDGRSDLPWLVTQPPGQLALRFIRSELIAPVSPVLVYGWWVRQPDLVRLLRENPHVRAVPIQPLNPAGRSDLPWLPQAPPGKAKPVGAPSSLAFPPHGWAVVSVTRGVILLTGSNQPIIILTGQGSGGVFDLTVFDPTVFDTGNTIALTGRYQPSIVLTGSVE